MSYTQAEKLQLLMLCDIHRALKIEHSYNPDLIEEAISSDNLWAIGWEYQSVHDGSENPPEVKLVVDAADMFRLLKHTYDCFSDEEKAQVSTAIPGFKEDSSLVFPGFDGNHESKYMSIGNMFKIMNLFTDLNLTKNTHSPYVEIYRRMLEVFLPARNDDWTHGKGISKESFISVLMARIHPSHR